MAENPGGSCEPCKRKKCKCDRQLPSCGQCDASKSACIYVESNKRGIPTGYLSQLEQRLGETEVLLYHALSELRAVKLQNTFSGIPHALAIPGPIPREANAGKQVRIEEWREYPLRTPEEVERWRQFLGGGAEISTPYDGPSREPSQLQHSGYHSLSNHRFQDSDPQLTYHHNDMDVDVATGLMGLSRSQSLNHNQIQNRQFTINNSDPPPTQLTAILDPARFPSPTPPPPLQQTADHHALATNYTVDSHPRTDIHLDQAIADPNSNPVYGQPSSSGDWEASYSGSDVSRQNARLQRPTELVKSQQLSAAFKNIYY